MRRPIIFSPWIFTILCFDWLKFVQLKHFKEKTRKANMYRGLISNRRAEIDYVKTTREKEQERDGNSRELRKRKERQFEPFWKKSSKKRSQKLLSDLPLDTISHGIMLFLNTRELVAFGITSRYFQHCFLESLPIKEFHSISPPTKTKFGESTITYAPLWEHCNANHQNLFRAHYLKQPRETVSEKETCNGIYWGIQHGALSTAKFFYNHYPASIPVFEDHYRFMNAVKCAIRNGHRDTLDWMTNTFDPAFIFSERMNFLTLAFEEGTLETVKWACLNGIYERGWRMFGLFKNYMKIAVHKNKVDVLEWFYTDPDGIRFPGFEPLTGEFAKLLLAFASHPTRKDALKWLQETIKKQ